MRKTSTYDRARYLKKVKTLSKNLFLEETKIGNFLTKSIEKDKLKGEKTESEHIGV